MRIFISLIIIIAGLVCFGVSALLTFDQSALKMALLLCGAIIGILGLLTLYSQIKE